MTEYIERDALLDDISAAVKHRGMGEIIGKTLMRYVKRQPTADVVPVVHGLWVEHLDEMECSVCKRQWNYCDNDTNTFNFCPNCGAKMDGEP